FHHPSTTKIHPLSLHDALPIFEGTARFLGTLLDPAQAPADDVRVRQLDDDTVGDPTCGTQGLGAVARHPDREFAFGPLEPDPGADRKSTRLNSSHVASSYAVFC